LTGYATDFLSPMPSVQEYFSLSIRLLIAFGVVFELPVVMVLLAKVGILTVGFLWRFQRYAILISFVVAAILTPTPDVVNQCLMAIPLILLYQIGIAGVWLFGRKRLRGFGDESAGSAPAE
jgi:sec-independent protein translocase protein TatC